MQSRFFTLSLILLCTSFLHAQSRTEVAKRFKLRANHQLITQETPSGHSMPLNSTSQDRWTPISLGTTRFDLQSYNSIPRRLNHNPQTGNVMGIWMDAQTTGTGNAWPDRGTACNFRESGAWLGETRVENNNARTGFPTSGLLGDGTFVSMAHRTTNGPPYIVEMSKYNTSTNTWTKTDLPTASSEGIIFPVMAVGGTDNNTIHMISTNWAPATARHLYYYRSTDGGATWPVSALLMPGLDTNAIKNIELNSFTIDARGNTVVVSLFALWGDSWIFKSTDNGDNWTSTKIYDFPLDGYVADQGYTFDDIPHTFGALDIDSLAIFTTDGVGDVIIDNNNKVHAFFGSAYVIDDNLLDTNTQYFVAIEGLNYWNEDYGLDSFNVIANLQDLNGNDTFDIFGNAQQVPNYFGNCLTSFPSTGINEAGILYVTYTGLVELSDANAIQNYHHVFVMMSADGGENWTEPYDVINPNLSDPDAYLYEEAVYPSMVRNVDDRLRIIYQKDNVPNSAVASNYNEALTSLTDNDIVYLELTDLLAPIASSVSSLKSKSLQVTPNPSNGMINVTTEAVLNKQLRWTLFSSTGQVAQHGELGNGLLDLSQQPDGLYFLQVTQGNQTWQQRVVIQK